MKKEGITIVTCDICAYEKTFTQNQGTNVTPENQFCEIILDVQLIKIKHICVGCANKIQSWFLKKDR